MQAPLPSRLAAAPVRVMIVDDSVVVRGLLGRWIGATPGFEVVGTAESGRKALELSRAALPDIVLLDLDMPELGGLDALPMLLADRPEISVIVVSTLTQRNAEISLRCLRMGAIDYLPKPLAARELTLALGFRDELIAKLDGIAARHRVPPRPAVPSTRPEEGHPALAHPPLRPRLVVIGASTGGPRAVIQVVRGLGRVAERLPILVVQHMPAIFTTVFARQIESDAGVPCREARSGEPLQPGRVLVAPGGRHLGLAAGVATPSIRLDDGPPLHHCRPALDVLLRDAATHLRGAALAVVLTGMGTDGLDGARALTEAGGQVLVQDEATSVVWGMPGSIARAGLARAVRPIDQIASSIEAAVGGGTADTAPGPGAALAGAVARASW